MLNFYNLVNILIKCLIEENWEYYSNMKIKIIYF